MSILESSDEDEDQDQALEFKRRRRTSSGSSPLKESDHKEISAESRETNSTYRNDKPYQKFGGVNNTPRQKSDWRVRPEPFVNPSIWTGQIPVDKRDPNVIKRQFKPIIETGKGTNHLFDSPVKIEPSSSNGKLVNDPLEYCKRRSANRAVAVAEQERLSPEELKVIFWIP